MKLKEFKNLKINLPPYFVSFPKDMSKQETKFSLNYHFFDNQQNKGIHVSFNKIKQTDENNISLWVNDLNLKDRDKQIAIFNFKTISKEKLEQEINNIRFEELYKSKYEHNL